jgi:cytochrome P450
MTEIDRDFDPLEPETFDSPHIEYAKLRSACPIAHTDRWSGFWALTRFDDILRVLSEPETFITSVQNVVPKVSFTGRRPPLHLDPPEHTPYRQALNPLFTSARMAELEPLLRSYVGQALSRLIERGHGDIVEEVSVPFPVHAFSLFLNVEETLMRDVQEVAVVYNRALQEFVDDEVRRTSLMLYDIARRLIEDRKRNPQDPTRDPTTALLQAKGLDGAPLPDEMILGTIRQVLVVGIIAPSVTIGSFVIHLSRHQDLQATLRAQPELLPAALEELLRLYTPYRGFARTAKRDVTLGGKLIREGEPIALVYASANRDGCIFADPDEFRLDRERKDHLAFGRGPHNCVGAPMARLELRVFFEELLRRTASFELDGEIRPTRWPEYGALSVPIRLTAAEACV